MNEEGIVISAPEVFGWRKAIKGARNPLESWERMDSVFHKDGTVEIGPNDLDLLKRLLKAGPEHSKYARMIHVQCDITFPRYVWSEADTYHFNTKNSTSTMHKLLNRKSPITKDLFVYNESDEDIITDIVNRMEGFRQQFLSKDIGTEEKRQLLRRAKQLLPEGFLQMRTFDTTYAELRNMYHQRKHHRLKEEWVDVFCKWVRTLPYAKELIIGEEEALNE